MVRVAQLVEHRFVVPDVAGSIPVSHPTGDYIMENLIFVFYGISFGAMLFFSSVIAPKIFSVLKEEDAGKFVRSIFSGDWNLGTLRIVLIKNKINNDIETVLRWFCNRGNLMRIALPKKIPWDKPIPNVPKITNNWIKGSLKFSARKGISAINLKMSDNKIWVSYYR